eukprot:402345-Amphidinium_carterae.1
MSESPKAHGCTLAIANCCKNRQMRLRTWAQKKHDTKRNAVWLQLRLVSSLCCSALYPAVKTQTCLSKQGLPH